MTESPCGAYCSALPSDSHPVTELTQAVGLARVREQSLRVVKVRVDHSIQEQQQPSLDCPADFREEDAL